MKVLPAAVVLANVGFSHGQSDLSPSSLGSAVPPRKFKLLIDYELGHALQSTRHEVCVIFNHQNRALYTKCESPPAHGQSGWSPRYPGTAVPGYDVISDPYTGTDYYTICMSNAGVGDGFLVDKVIIQQERHGIDGDVTRVGPSFNWPFGPATDDGRGWCLSTRTDDWRDFGDKVAFPTCQQCLSVDFDGNWAWGRRKPYKCPSRRSDGWCETCVGGAACKNWPAHCVRDEECAPASRGKCRFPHTHHNTHKSCERACYKTKLECPKPYRGFGTSTSCEPEGNPAYLSILPSTSHLPGEDITIEFSYPDNPGPDTWIALAPADSDPSAVPSPSINWSYTCSGTKSSTCTSVRKCGTVTLGAATAKANKWPITCGKWKAYLLPNGRYKSVAESEPFVIGNQECRRSEGRNSAEGNVAWGFENPKAKNLRGNEGNGQEVADA